MKKLTIVSAAFAAITMVGAAIAQPTTTTATSQVAPPTPVAAPSTCPAYPAVPALPAPETIRNQRELNAGTEVVNNYLAAYQTVHNCRINEVQSLKATSDARVTEAKAAQDAALAFRANWQAVADGLAAKGKKK